jgi:hypothetical protein
MSRFDQEFNVRLQSHYTVVNDIYAPAKYYGDTPEQIALSLGTYAYGRIFNQPKVSHLGMDLLRAQAITEALVEPSSSLPGAPGLTAATTSRSPQDTPPSRLRAPRCSNVTLAGRKRHSRTSSPRTSRRRGSTTTATT